MSCKRHKKSSFCKFFASHGLIFAQKSRPSKLHACNSSTSAHEEASTYAFRLWQAYAAASRSPKTCDRDKEPRGGFDESTPTQGSAMAPTCGELCDPPPYPLRGLSPPPSAAHASLRRSHPTAPPTPQTASLSSCPSNKFASPLFAHIFSLNYYKTINKITKAHHRAWHQQVCHPASWQGSGFIIA